MNHRNLNGTIRFRSHYMYVAHTHAHKHNIQTCTTHTHNNNRLFRAPHLLRAWSRIHHHHHHHHHPHTHTHIHTHTREYTHIHNCTYASLSPPPPPHKHTRYKYMHYWLWVDDKSVCRREEVGFQFWFKLREWRRTPDRVKKKVPEDRSDVLKGSLPRDILPMHGTRKIRVSEAERRNRGE